jgi:hypothetical protein
VIFSPYDEGLLPAESHVILNALRELEIKICNAYVETYSLVEEEGKKAQEEGKVRTYFNRRFYRYSVDPEFHGEDMDDDIPSLMKDEGPEAGKSLFGYEGHLFPSTIERSVARNAGFDSFTVCNLSFMDIGYKTKYVPNLFSAGTQVEKSMEIAKESLLPRQGNKVERVKNYPEGTSVEEIKVNQDKIREAFVAMKEKFEQGAVHDAFFVEEEMYERILNNLNGAKILKVLKVVLQDYKHGKTVHIALLEQGARKAFLV